MSIAVISLIVAVIINIMLGLFIFTRNPRSKQSIAFFLATLSISAWTIANYLTDNASTIGVNSFFNRLAFFFAFQVFFCFTWFSFYFPRTRKISASWRTRLLVLYVVGSLFSITNVVVGSVSAGSEGPVFTPGKYVAVFGIVLLGLLALIIANLVRSLRTSNTEEKSQIKLIIFGFSVTAILAVATNIIIPLVYSDWQSTKIGPLITVILVASIAYAIVRHGLFDIRLIVARSVGYILSVVSLGVVYGFVTFLVIGQIFYHDQSITLYREFIFTLVAILLALSFQPLKRFFDKITNKLFYRDAYEPQELVDSLNKVLVGNIELKDLLSKSGKVISEIVKCEFCVFAIEAVNKIPERIIGNAGRYVDQNSFASIRELASKVNQKAIVTDRLNEPQKLQELLHRQDIGVLVDISGNTHNSDRSLGYMVIGVKRSGNPYSEQDIKILEIITDELVIAIQNALRFEEIESFNLTLQQKIDEATRKLRQTNDKLRALDETKDEFISMASHQLRTPLTSVKGYISMVLEGDAGKVSDMQKKLLDQAFISSQRMVYLIADLLNVSRLRTGKFIIEQKPTQLADIIESEIAQLTETAKGRGLELTYTKPKDFPMLMLDETKTRQVIMNFADNAIYYTQSGTNRGHISINLEDKGSSVEFTVVDDGIGVPKTAQHHLFTKFYRAGNAQHARPDGTGLGLFMAKKVIIAQGGAIVFHSEEGKGSIFGFSFPKAKLKVPEHLAPPAEPAKTLVKKA